ncbi:MAG: zinc-binding dehydrogenase [Acidimicrobiia bacterium]
MKALHLDRAGGPLRLVELADPEPGPGEALVRVHAAGICRSDVHYRAGDPRLPPLPRVLGHEISGTVAALGPKTTGCSPGDRVGVHYQTSCGECPPCLEGGEQFCVEGAMIGNHRDGGFAEYVVVPASNLVSLPQSVDFDSAAIMMCSSATSLHALRRARLRSGETVAVYGLGGLGFSALQLARWLGASDVVGVDIDQGKVERARRMGFDAVDASEEDPVAAIQALGGADVALELIGLPLTTTQALQSLRPRGRAAIVGLTGSATEVAMYDDLMRRETELIGVMDHLYAELVELMEIAQAGGLDLSGIVSRTVPLDAGAVNRALDDLESFGGDIRTVIHPGAPAQPFSTPSI